jgi:hypothetical protein
LVLADKRKDRFRRKTHNAQDFTDAHHEERKGPPLEPSMAGTTRPGYGIRRPAVGCSRSKTIDCVSTDDYN